MKPLCEPTWLQRLISSVLAGLMALPGNVLFTVVAADTGPARPAPQVMHRTALPPNPAATARPDALPASPKSTGVHGAALPSLGLLSATTLAPTPGADGLPAVGSPAPSAATATPAGPRRGVALASGAPQPQDDPPGPIEIIEVEFELIGDQQAAVTIRFEVEPSRQYIVEYRDQFGIPDFCEPWKQLPNAPHNSGEVIDLDSRPSRFYRVRAVESPQDGLFALLARDTGPRSYDGLTSDPAITGEVTLTGPGLSLWAALDNPEGAYTPLLESIDTPQHFTVSTEAVHAFANGTLPDGAHTLYFALLNDTEETLATETVGFVVDTTPPTVTADLDPATDTLPVGDLQTEQHWVRLAGRTEPDALVRLEPGGLWTIADDAGNYLFDLIELTLGANAFTLRAFDQACVERTVNVAITRLQPGIDFPFDDTLTGWQQRIATPRSGTAGSISVENGNVTLTEGDSFEVTLERDLTIPAGAGMLYLSYAAPNFDTTTAHAMNDAFEVALVDAEGRPLTYTIQAAAGILPASQTQPPVLPASATACFNHTQGLEPFMAPGTEVRRRNLGGYTLRVDIRHLAPNSHARLVLRLVNNDRDRQSNLQILALRFVPPSPEMNFPGSLPPALSPLIGPDATAPRRPAANEVHCVGNTTYGPAIITAATDFTDYFETGFVGPETPDGDSVLAPDGRLVFTITAEFERASLFNLTANSVADELRLVARPTTFPWLWVANAGEDTVSKIDTRTGREVARYQTWFGPAGQPGYLNHLGNSYVGAAPSRTAIDRDGSAYVANRHFDGKPASVMKMLLNDFVDRNGNGVAETSGDIDGDGIIDVTEILPLGDLNGSGQVEPGEIRDERVAWLVSVGPPNGLGRSLAIDALGNIWLGLWNAQLYYKLSSEDGRILAGPFDVSPHQPYGALVDRNGVLWGASARTTLLKFDTLTHTRHVYTHDSLGQNYGIALANDLVYLAARGNCSFMVFDPVSEAFSVPARQCFISWSVCADSAGNIYSAPQAGGYVTKFAPDGGVMWSKATGPRTGEIRGIVVDADDDVWLIHRTTNKISKHRGSDGSFVGVFPVGDQPYTYTDATGLTRFTTTDRRGTWTEIVDSDRPANVWGTVALTTTTPLNTSVTLKVRAADTRGSLPSLPKLTVVPGQPLPGFLGRFLEIEVTLGTDLDAATPSVQDITILAVPPPTIISGAPGGVFTPGTTLLLNGKAVAARPALPDGSLLANHITHLLLNGTPLAAVDAAGTFYTPVDIRAGRNEFQFTGYDLFGLSATNTLVIWGACVNQTTQLEAVSGSVQGVYGRTSFNDWTKTLYADVALRNVGNHPIRAPLYVGISRISEPTVQLLAADGTTPDGIPYYDFTSALAADALTTDAPTAPRTLAFHNPDQLQFTYELVVLGQLNQPPQFTTVPPLEAIVGKPYTYAFSATDPDGDPLTYALLVGPSGMALNAQPLTLNFQPSTDQTGTHEVRILADDGRGGLAEQRFVISIITEPANRPPFFTSTPITVAQVPPLTAGSYEIAWQTGDIRLSHSDQPSVSPTLVVDPLGDIHVVYTEGPDMGYGWFYDIHYARLHPDGTMVIHSQPLGFPGWSDAATIAVTPAAGVNLAWHSWGLVPGEEIFHALLSEAGVAQRMTQLTSTPTTVNTDYPHLLAGSGDTLFLVVQDEVNDPIDGDRNARRDVFIQKFSVNAEATTLLGSFVEITSAEGLGYPNVGYVGTLGRPAIDAQDQLHVVWTDWRHSTDQHHAEVYYECVSESGVTLVDELPVSQIDDVGSDMPTVLVDSSGIAHVFWDEIEGSGVVLKHVRIDTTGRIVDRQDMITGPPGSISSVSLALDRNDRIHLVRMDSSGPQTLMFYQRFDQFGSLLVNPIQVTQSSRSAWLNWAYTSIDVAADGRFTVVWTDTRDGNKETYVKSFSVRELAPASYAYDADAQDPDSDPLTFSLPEKPDGMNINPATGLIGWAPSDAQLGVHNVTVEVSDERGGTARQSFQILVQSDPDNHAPVIVSEPREGIVLGQQYSYDVDALDADGDPLAYRLERGPEGMGIDAATGLISWDVPADLLAPNTVVFSDGEFDLDDWTWSKHTTGQGGSLTVTELSSGGHPGRNLEFGLSLQGEIEPDELNGILCACFKKNATYNPASGGAIYAVSYEDESSFVSGAGDGFYTGPAVLQSGHVYVQMFRLPSDSAWQASKIETLMAADFVMVRPIGTSMFAPDQHPDFSASGAPLQFGFGRWYRNCVGCSNGKTVNRIDNWRVTILPAPHMEIEVHVSDGQGGVDVQGFPIGVVQGETLSGLTFQDADKDGRFDVEAELLIGGGFESLERIERYTFPQGVLLERFEGTAPRIGYDGMLYTVHGQTVAVRDPLTSVLKDAFTLEGDWFLGACLPVPGSKVFVTDAYSDSVIQVDLANRTMTPLRLRAPGLDGPSGIVSTPDSTILVASSLGSKQIHRFDRDTGTYLGGFGGPGLHTPAGMTVGDDIMLYVADYYRGNVLEFDARNGRYLRTAVAAGAGGLDHPWDVEIGPDGHIYVCSVVLHKVMRFHRATGAYLGDLIAGDVLFSPYWLEFVSGTGDSPDGPLPDWQVYLDGNANGRFDSHEAVALTDAHGRFEFHDVPPGTWVVRPVEKDGWSATVSGTDYRVVTVTEGESVYRVDFPRAEVPSGALNRVPEFFSSPPLTAKPRELYRYVPVARDPDGHTLTFQLSLAPEGMAVHPGSGIVAWTPREDQAGRHQALLKVDDGQGGTAVQFFEIQVLPLNTPPVITSVPTLQAVVDRPYEYVVRAQDAEGDALAFTLAQRPEGMTIAPSPQPANTALVAWTPTSAQLGANAIEVVVTDAQGGEARQPFTVEVVATAQNQAPFFTSVPSTHARAGVPYAYLVQGKDPDGDPITFQLAAAPSGMTLNSSLSTLHSALLQWTPAAAQVGRHEARLQLDDGRGGVAEQGFTIEVTSTIANQAPSIVSTPPLHATVEQPYAYDLQAEDPEDDPVVWELVLGPRGMSLDTETGALRWTPGAEQAGSVNVAVRATDSLLASSTQGFTIEVGWLNRSPQIASTPPTKAPKGQPYLYAARATDPDGDRIQWFLLVGPTAMTIDTATGLLRWTPTEQQMGSHTVTIQASDGRGGAASQAYALLAADFEANHPPVIVSEPPLTVRLGQTWRYAVAATDADPDILTVQLLVAPPGAAFTPATSTPGRAEALIEWTPTQQGTYEFVLVARDPLGAAAAQRFFVRARSNNPPQINSTPRTTAQPGVVYRYDILAWDPDGDALAYRLLTAPPTMTIDRYGRINWTPSRADVGEHPVSVQVSDTYATTATQDFVVTVEADEEPPVVELEIPYNLYDPATDRYFVLVGTEVWVRVLATDNVGVATRSLTIDGVEVPLGSEGAALVPFPKAGLFEVVGRATDVAGNVGMATETVPVMDPAANTTVKITILSPENGGAVTRPTEIVGTITSDRPLERYIVDYAELTTETGVPETALADPRVEYRPLNSLELPADSNVTRLERIVLAEFDPTLLQNGFYLIRVRAFERGIGQGRAEGVGLNVTGELKFGEFRLEFTDLAIPVAGTPITIGRVYDSRDSPRQGDFGFGWSLAAKQGRFFEVGKRDGYGLLGNEQTLTTSTRVYLTKPDGRRVGFTLAPTLEVWALLGTLYRPTFKADPGVYDTLEPAGDDLLAVNNDGTVTAPLFNFIGYNPSTYYLTTKDGTRYRYDETEGLQEITDLNGNRLDFTSGGIFHYAAGATEPDQSVLFQRDPQGRIVRVIDPNGKALTYTYDDAGDLRGFADQEANLTQYTYKTERPHYLDTIIDPLGRQSIRTEYDEAGRLVSITDAMGHPVKQDFNFDDNIGTYTDANGHITYSQYDNRGNETAKWIEGIYTNRFEYDANNNLTNTVDGRGFETHRAYDSRGNLTKIVDALSNVTAIAYNDLNKPTSVTDALGHTTHFGYDSRGELTNVINALGGQAAFTRDDQGHVTSVTDFNGHTTTYDYANGCGCGKPGKVVNPDGTFRQYDYNGYGQTTREVNELGHATVYDYDEVGRLKSVTDAMGHTTRYTYDGALKTSETDPLNRTTWYTYDALNRQIAITNAMGGVVKFEYDKGTNRTAVIDPVTNVTRFYYDANNRLSHQVDPFGRTNFFTYDPAGNRIETIDRNERRRTFEYDALSRRTKELWWEGDSLLRVIEFTFSPVGALTTVSDPAGRLAFGFDVLNRLESATQSGIAGLADFALTYSFDGVGNVLCVTDNWGAQVVSEYDARSRLTRRIWHGDELPGASLTFEHDAAGNLTSNKRYADVAGNQLVGQSAYAFSAMGAITDIVHADRAGAPLAAYHYERDAARQIIQRTISDQLAAFDYDLTGQLTGAIYAPQTQPNERYRYDGNGNRIGGGYEIGANNQILTDGTFRYAHDAEGNLVGRTHVATGMTTSYYYDHRNLLIRVVDKDTAGTDLQTVEFTYDPINRRVSKSVNNAVTWFLHDGLNAIADLNAHGSITVRYLFGTGIDEILARFSPAEGLHWYLADSLSTVRDSANSAGAIANHIDYDSFGLILKQSAPETSDRFTFTAREWDTETQLLYCRARFYSPRMGRFLSQDPFGLRWAEWNPYMYTRNSPVNFSDPTGCMTFSGYMTLIAAEWAAVGISVAVSLYANEGVQEAHYTRNRWNVCPPCHPPDCATFPAMWKKRQWYENVFHQGTDVWTAPDFQRPWASYECAYDSQTRQYVSGGTYNFVDHRVWWFGHVVLDMFAHIIYYGHYQAPDPTTR